jgi:hypothetical protein
LSLSSEKLVSNFAFKFNLYLYTAETVVAHDVSIVQTLVDEFRTHLPGGGGAEAAAAAAAASAAAAAAAAPKAKEPVPDPAGDVPDAAEIDASMLDVDEDDADDMPIAEMAKDIGGKQKGGK